MQKDNRVIIEGMREYEQIGRHKDASVINNKFDGRQLRRGSTKSLKCVRRSRLLVSLDILDR